jgi:hypothetical protein
MKKFDMLWGGVLALITVLLLSPVSHDVFVELSRSHMYRMAFAKFAVLATMGELLALRLVSGGWHKPAGLIWRAVIWGVLGAVIALVFKIYAAGVSGALQSGLLPSFGSGFGSQFAFAFFTSVLMNSFFAPTFMAFHRVTDSYIDLGRGNIMTILSLRLPDVLATVDWNGFIRFVVCKTIPLFWIPAHTITFLLPPDYRVLMAAFLSIALGAILGFAKKGSAAQPAIPASQPRRALLRIRPQW